MLPETGGTLASGESVTRHERWPKGKSPEVRERGGGSSLDLLQPSLRRGARANVASRPTSQLPATATVFPFSSFDEFDAVGTASEADGPRREVDVGCSIQKDTQPSCKELLSIGRKHLFPLFHASRFVPDLLSTFSLHCRLEHLEPRGSRAAASCSLSDCSNFSRSAGGNRSADFLIFSMPAS